MDINITTKKIEVGTPTIKATWSKELAEDLNKMHGINFDVEEQIRQQIIRERRDAKIDEILNDV